MKKQICQNQRGSTLAVVIVTMAVLITIVGIATEYTTTVNRNVLRGSNYETALAIGDSCIEILFANWRTTCRGVPASSAPPTTSALAAVPTPIPSLFPDLANFPPGAIPSTFVKRSTNIDPDTDDYDGTYTISNYKVIAVSPELSKLTSSTTAPTLMLGRMGGNVASGSSLLPTISGAYNYIASADVTLPGVGPAGKVVARVRRVFQRQQMSPMDFALFYIDPLEIHPGPKFTITGAVHTNSDLWTGHDTLTFGDKVTYGGSWNVDFMTGDNTHPETPSTPTFLAGLPPSHIDPYEMPTAGSVSNANTADGYREIIEPPVTGTTDPYASQRYWDQAGIVIEVSDNPSSTKDGWDGVPGHDLVKLYTVDSSSGVKTALTNGELYKLFSAPGVITTNQTIQDNREGASVRVASLDISKIVSSGGSGNPTYLHPGSKFGTGASNQIAPIVYMYNTSATPSSRRAIRVTNGEKIPTAGLTVTSNNPVYIQGDFNTGGNGTTNNNVPSNNPSNLNADGTYVDPSNPPNSYASGYTRAPAAVLADAVNILSNNWSDSNSTASLSSRPATPTTVNAAIISGIVPTNINNDGDYSGGAENFPRLHEDWTNKSLTYYGSMVELWTSTSANNSQATGEWHYGGNIYNAPARNWFYDSNFKTNRPPGSIMAMVVTYSKGRWTVE